MPDPEIAGQGGGDQRIDLAHDLNPAVLGRDPGSRKRHKRSTKFTPLFAVHQIAIQGEQIGVDFSQFRPKVAKLGTRRKGVIGRLLQTLDLTFDQITPTRQLPQTQLQTRQAVDQIGRSDRN